MLRSRLTAAGFVVERISYFNTVLFPAVAAVRLARGKREARGRSDMAMPSQAINAVLRVVFASERFALRFAPLPFGVSLLAVAHAR